MENCVFCKIVRGEIPSKRYYEDDDMIIIADIAPKAKLHYLAVPKEHYKGLDELDEKRKAGLVECFEKIGRLKDTLGLTEGYRLIINQGENGGQTVPHLHIHILGGEKLPGD